MRIGLFTDTYAPDINGVVSSIITLQKKLQAHDHEVFIITNHKAISMKKEGNVIRLPGLELKWLYGYKLSTPYHFSAKEAISKMNLDIIHVHTEFGVGIFGRIVARHLKIPVVSTYHTMYEDYTHYINRFDIHEVEKVSKKVVSSISRSISDSVQAVISPSEKTKEKLLEYGVKTPIYVVPTGLDFKKFNDEFINQSKINNIKTKYGIKSDDKIIIFVGRIAKEKSIEIPLEGIQYIKDSHIKLMIVGGGPQLNELQKLAKSLQIDDRVIFTDKQAQDDIPSFYATAEVFVSASLSETQGMTFIEALACGLPVFARHDEVLLDVVVENKSGFFFEDAKSFAQKVEAFMQQSTTQRKQFSKMVKTFVKKYDSEVFYAKMLSVYYQTQEDYHETYEVIKIKLIDDNVRIQVENPTKPQPMHILISYDDYLAYKINKHTLLDKYTVSTFLEKQKRIDAYRSAIKKLANHDYTVKEMFSFLTRSSKLSETQISETINELIAKNYLNDEQYAIHKINKMQHSLIGKSYIRTTLIKKGIDLSIVDQYLKDNDDNEEQLRAFKLAQKLLNTIRDTSLKMKRQKLFQKLLSKGFESHIVHHAIEEIEFVVEDEEEALNKCITKARKMYEKKYSGYPLRVKVYQSCISKGFSQEKVEIKLDEMEWQDEN